VPAGSTTRTSAWLLAALALAASPLARADFQEDYALGLQSIDEGRYQDARMYLKRALDAQPGPVSKVILNGNVEQPYLPYHFLGIVAYELGECDVARQQWEDPTNQRMLGRLNAIRRLEQRMTASCKPRQPAVAAEAPKPAAPSPPPSQPAAPPPAAEEPAKNAPEKASEKPPEKPSARPPEKAPEKTPVKTVEKTPEKTPPSTPESAKPPPEVDRTPPARLVRAVDSYLAGRYADAARISPESVPAGRARFHAFLIRCAARYTLAELDGDKQLLAAARSDARAAKAIDAAAVPDRSVFSPKFLAFYAEAR
jgi:hypothetical protein